ncbi:DUF2752 domain-containing protein [Rhodococcus sp. G-MC3]|uniref:DUF2752 domain-containing protein n=1 Tax=Rhodococcus sp. G-MC3 TaxID=3046209 RepID=UPI0024BA3DB4|nr:DUF2752 domain-containing protein [Rhodococcus sp. G-MC3]MDJ0393468.1 DUF2752 domain-containing protein [Rhodococcus sp. G-MC3]
MATTGTSRRNALAAPVSVAAAAVASGAVLYFRDPRTSTYLPCPFHAMTGLWCPGCGATRAAGNLVHGDVASAMSSNILAVLLLVVGVAVWGLWARARATGRTLDIGRPPRWFVIGGLAVLVSFTVLRNLPVGSALAP